MNYYRLTAEAQVDIDRLDFQLNIHFLHHHIYIRHLEAMTGVECIIETHHTIRRLKEVIASIEDGHVMLRTVRNINQLENKL